MTNPKCIAIIDSDEIATFVTKAFVQDLGICDQIETFADPNDAIDKLEKLPIKLAIFDLNTQSIEREVLLEKLMELSSVKDFKILVLTNVLKKEETELMERLDIPFVFKPLNDQSTNLIKKILLPEL